MNQSHRIRSGLPSDAFRLAALAAQVWSHTYAIDGIDEATARYMLAEFTADRYRRWLGEPSLHFLLAECGENLIGFARVMFGARCPAAAGSSAELQTLYVQEHRTGRGIGQSLLHAAEALARQRSEPALWLTVNARNERAIRFYAGRGYAKVGTADFVLAEGGARHENHVLVGRGA